MPRKNKKEDILQAAIKVYGYYGFEGATIERIAEHAGVSRALIMKYYESKQDLVKEIVNHVAADHMERVRHIEKDDKLTFRQREDKLFQLLKPKREEWCLLIGTLLVPNFQFQLRGAVTDFLMNRNEANKRFFHELKDPSPDALFSLSYSMTQLKIGYVLDGNQEHFIRARDYQLDLYLLPEEKIAQKK